MSVSALAQTLKGSEIIKIGGEINELKKQGEKIANLTIGDFDPSVFPIGTGAFNFSPKFAGFVHPPLLTGHCLTSTLV
jgi:thiamine biosynthesis lipoprotein ApbE